MIALIFARTLLLLCRKVLRASALRVLPIGALALLFGVSPVLAGPDAGPDAGQVGAGSSDFSQRITDALNSPISNFANWLESIIFWSPNLPVTGPIPLVLLLLAGAALFLTLYFGFINLRALGLAIRTIGGKYTRADAPGEITHFQALSAALSATVGLGNIAGVAIAIGIGGPGATLWMIFLGLCGMTTKFAECTLGLRYRKIDRYGKAHGGAMYFLTRGLTEGKTGATRSFFHYFGWALAIFFSLAAVGAALGAGNLYQANQAYALITERFHAESTMGQWVLSDAGRLSFGVLLALLVGSVIIGGIRSIGRFTSILVPFMCLLYVGAGAYVLIDHWEAVPAAMVEIVEHAFAPTAVVGGFVGAMIQGIKRAAFSNEAGVGSAPIAHSAVKTDQPASEGLVALLEPAIDTLVVCTMTALVIVVTGEWKVDARVLEDSSARVLAVDMDDLSSARELASKDDFDEAAYLLANASARLKLPAESELRLTETLATDQGLWGKIYPETGLLEYFSQAHPELTSVRNLDRGKEGINEHFVDETGGEQRFVQLWVPLENNGIITQMDIKKTSSAFGKGISWFPLVLTVSVVLFAFSTMLSWSYYGEQAVLFLCGGRYITGVVYAYKILFCLVVVLGSVVTSGVALGIGDSFFFAMVIPNLIGVFLLLPKVRESLREFLAHARAIDRGEKNRDDVPS